MITGVMDVRTERWMKKKTKIRGGVDLYEMSLLRGDIVARRPPPTANIIGSAGQHLVWPNFGCFIDAALTAPRPPVNYLCSNQPITFVVQTPVVAFLQ